MSSTTPPDDALREKTLAQAERLERIEAMLRDGVVGGAKEIGSLAVAVSALGELVGRGFEQMAELLAEKPAARAVGTSESAAAASATDRVVSVGDARESHDAPVQAASGEGLSEWERAILGDALADDPGLAFHRRRFVQAVLEGKPAACGLAGALLSFRAAPPERLPQLLKEIGEAFYRWAPKPGDESSALEEALAASLARRCEKAGLSNTIELVHPGQRFDAARHNATSRGVEIAAVQGWIVLREGGKVYTKAAVAAR